MEYCKGKGTSLTRNQKESAALLQIGTFLEYFDLMLYVHMSVVLNDLFFPKTDSYTSQLITASTFCTTFVLRPFGALFFGYLGDTRGRKLTLVITTFAMAAACFLMGCLPTYAEIGIQATWIMILCKIVQGMSSMEEAVGAEIYLTESSIPPIQYPLVNTITICSALGGTAALGVAALVTNYNHSWRWAFFAGAAIALVGNYARSGLRETPEFIEAKHKQALVLAKLNEIKGSKQKIVTKVDKVGKKTMLYYFLIQCARPVLFYFSYVYSIDILKGSFHCATDYIVLYLFYLALVDLVGIIIPTYLSYRIDPLKILKVKTYIFGTFILFFPYLLTKASCPLHLFYIQSFFVLFRIDSSPAAPIFYSHFPVLKRFTYAGVMYAVSRALLYIITSYGFVILIKHFGYGGMLFIMLPTIIGFYFSIRYFQKLKKERAAKQKQESFI